MSKPLLWISRNYSKSNLFICLDSSFFLVPWISNIVFNDI
jgi:hypothetical protein